MASDFTGGVGPYTTLDSNALEPLIFAPTATDYLILIVLPSFSASGGSFFWPSCQTPRQRATGLRIGFEAKRRQKREVETTANRLTLFETLLLVLLNTVVVTSFVLPLTAQFGLFRFRHWCLFRFVLAVDSYLSLPQANFGPL